MSASRTEASACGARAVVAATLGAGALVVTGCCAYSSPGHRGPVTDHFDGARFSNPTGASIDGLAVARWLLTRQPAAWPDRIDEPPGPKPMGRVAGGAVRVTLVNHATLLVQMDGVNVLTDPVWSERVGPEPWAGPRRRREPGIRFEDLPPIDVVLVSHNHYDHLDVPTLDRLAAAHRPTIVAGLGTRAILEKAGIRGGLDLDWWQGVDVAQGVRVYAVPAQHGSRRGLCDGDRTLWAGFVVAGPSGRVFFAGDTGYGPHFGAIRGRFGPMRVALLPIGAFRPEAVLGPVHMSPSDAVRAHDDLAAGTSIAMHYGTFVQSDEGVDEPLVELARALAAHRGEAAFWALRHGEGRALP